MIFNCHIPDDLDGESLTVLSTGTDCSLFGAGHTPKGDLKVLIVYATYQDMPGWTESDMDVPEWPAGGFPNYVSFDDTPPYGNLNTQELIFNKPEDFDENDPNSAINKSENFRSISRVLNLMSKPNNNFRLYADVFRDASGKPIVVDVDPVGCSGTFCLFNRLDYRMNELNPNFDFSSFDTRDNRPNYDFDNSVSNQDGSPASGDGTPDYIIISWRHRDQSSNRPNNISFGWGGVASTQSSWGAYPFSSPPGFAMQDINNVNGVFLHEWAHTIYSCPHFGGANHVCGNYFTPAMSGWGATAQTVPIRGPMQNSWERWYQGHITPYEVPDGNLTATFTVRDFVTTGDAIRVEIPYSNGQYLWLENHTNKDPLDKSDWLGVEFNIPQDPSISTTTVSELPTGLYGFVENIAGDHATTSVVVSGANGIKWLNNSGNWSFEWDESVGYTTNNWSNKLYRFDRGVPDPIGGVNPFLRNRNNFDNSNDNTIGYCNHFNSGSQGPYGCANTSNESNGIAREFTDNEDRYLYRHMGCHESGYENYTNGPQMNVGDEWNMGTNPIIINHPYYDETNNQVAPYYLNGLSVEVLSINDNAPITSDDYKAITVKITFKQTSVSNDVRWTNDVVLPNITNDSDYDLVLEDYKNIFIDLSKTSNRHTFHPNLSGFVNPSNFTLDNSSIKVKPHGCIVIEDNSTMTIGANSKILLEDNARIVVKNTAKLIIETGGEIEALGNAQIVVENGGELEMRLGSGLDLVDGETKLVLAGKLTTTNTDFTFGGAGFAEIHPSHIFDIEDSKGIVLNGTGKGNLFLKLLDGSHISLNGNYLDLKDGKVEYGENTSISVSNTNYVFAESVDFEELGNAEKTSIALYCTSLDQVEIIDCKFERFDTGLHLSSLNYTLTGFPKLISDSHFTNCNVGLLANNNFKLNIENCIFDLIREQGVWLSNMKTVDFIDNTINGYHASTLNVVNQGVYLDKVLYASFVGGVIVNFNIGIRSEESNIFLRNGAVVSDNGFGIESINSESNLVVVGDRGCGHIINNSTGIYGKNIILDIDSYIHATLDQTGVLTPNRFDGNNKIFNICNSHPSITILNVLAKGNYWGGGSINNSSYYVGDLVLTPPGEELPITGLNGYPYPPCNIALSVDDTDWLSYAPPSSTCSMPEIPFNPIDPDGKKVFVECVKCENGLIFNIHNQYSSAETDLVERKIEDAKLKYIPVVSKETSMTIGEFTPVCAHQMNVGKVLARAEAGLISRMSMNIDDLWVDGAVSENSISSFDIFPIPSSGNITISSIDFSADKFSFKLVDLAGRLITNGKFRLDETMRWDDLESGVYFLEISDLDGKLLDSKKILIE